MLAIASTELCELVHRTSFDRKRESGGFSAGRAHYSTFQRTSLQVNCVQCRKVLHGSIQYISKTLHYITVQWNTLHCSVGGSDRAGNDKLIYIFLQHSFSQQLSPKILTKLKWHELKWFIDLRYDLIISTNSPKAQLFTNIVPGHRKSEMAWV